MKSSRADDKPGIPPDVNLIEFRRVAADFGRDARRHPKAPGAATAFDTGRLFLSRSVRRTRMGA